MSAPLPHTRSEHPRARTFDVPAHDLLCVPPGPAARGVDAALRDLPARRYAVTSTSRGFVAHGPLSLEELFARAGTTSRTWASSAPPDALVRVTVVTSASGNDVVVSFDMDGRDDPLAVTSISAQHATALAALSPQQAASEVFADVVAASPERVAAAAALARLPHTATFVEVLDELGRCGLDGLDGGSRSVAAGLARSWTSSPAELVVVAAALGDAAHAPSPR